MTEQQLSQMWDIAEQFEVIGMKQAGSGAGSARAAGGIAGKVSDGHCNE